MIKLGVTFVNVLLVMKEQTVKMVSKNNGQKSTSLCADSVWEISTKEAVKCYNIYLACKILGSLLKGFSSYLAMDLSSPRTPPSPHYIIEVEHTWEKRELHSVCFETLKNLTITTHSLQNGAAR